MPSSWMVRRALRRWLVVAGAVLAATIVLRVAPLRGLAREQSIRWLERFADRSCACADVTCARAMQKQAREMPFPDEGDLGPALRAVFRADDCLDRFRASIACNR